MPRLRLAVLLSGSGTTLENLFEKTAAGELDAEIVVVVSSRADAYGIERAKKRGVPTFVVPRKTIKDVAEFSRQIYRIVDEHKAEAIALAGFMSLLEIPKRFENRVFNVHPALLPAFGGKGNYGHHVHEAVLKAGCKTTGCTVHFVDQEYDHGPIILKREVPVQPDDTPDTLAARVQATEREIFPRAIQLFAEGKLEVVSGLVQIKS